MHVLKKKKKYCPRKSLFLNSQKYKVRDCFRKMEQILLITQIVPRAKSCFEF